MMLAAIGAVVLAGGLGAAAFFVVFFSAALRGLCPALDSLPWAITAFLVVGMVILWGVGHG
ncbi:hypothetical protein [Pararhodobacter aggregans]|uniref:Uncharacterized protein n=1 Tax=Pararhodobacter aggregans TaxID=404875 RepID=A0A2T7UR71_9RHOB|nr:hypothetical protein [Pararhodobacter aggregans]PTX02049.1 hypothetical protein C8N33_106268 [Pararhodobacter aggregans]PVE47223.1 hypothetical protein DDE23_13355 [Pararhodobacter aggregans]